MKTYTLAEDIHPEPMAFFTLAELERITPDPVRSFPPVVRLASGEDVADPTWHGLARHEPLLESLLMAAQAVRRPHGKSFCTNDVWYGSLKPFLTLLVGWECLRDDPYLSTSDAYDLAYQTIYNALPDCRGCICL